MFEKIKAFEQWMQDNTFNGSQHMLYGLIAILIAFFSTDLRSLFYAFMTYLVFIVIFYLVEVYQAVSWDKTPFLEALNFTLWSNSKIEDVAAHIIGGGICMGILSYVPP